MGFGHPSQRMHSKKGGQKQDAKGQTGTQKQKKQKASRSNKAKRNKSGLCFGLPIDSWLP
jgi:hypothetical protein